MREAGANTGGTARAPTRRIAYARRALLGLLLVPAASAPAEESPAASCRARLQGDRIVVETELTGFFDEDTLSLVRLGLKGRLHLEAVAYRKRLGLFEQTVALQAMDIEVVWSRSAQALGVGSAKGLAPGKPITLERLALRLGEPARTSSRLLVRMEARLQVVTVRSLSKVAAWATGSSEEEVPSLLTRSVLSAVAQDLTRSASCECSVESPAAGASPPR